MLATTLFTFAALCLFPAGFAAGRGCRVWGEDAEIDPLALRLTRFFLLLAVASFVGGACA